MGADVGKHLPTRDLSVQKPPRRSKNAAAKGGRVELRANDEQRAAWILAASREGYLSLSDWMRDRLDGAARSRVLLSSDHQAWNTPRVVLDALEPLGPIALDPCSNGTSIVGARVAWTLADDGLASSWAACIARTKPRGFVYVNPPFNELDVWIARCAQEASAGCEVVALVPNRPDTAWMAGALESGATRGDWRGRVRFIGATNSAPFPIALLYWGPRVELFRAALRARVSAFAVDHRADPRQVTIDHVLAQHRQAGAS